MRYSQDKVKVVGVALLLILLPLEDFLFGGIATVTAVSWV